MQLVKFLNKLFKKGGFILEDAYGKEHVVGSPNSQKSIKLKIHDKKLHYKLLLYPDLYFGEAYTDGSITIEGGSLSDFLNIALENLGRQETNVFGKIFNRLTGSYRYLTNFNFIKKSKMNAAYAYDISDELYSLFLGPSRQYSCAYFKDEKETLEQAQQNKINHIIKKLHIRPNQKFWILELVGRTLPLRLQKNVNVK